MKAITPSTPSIQKWVVYALFSAALVYTHYFGFFILFSHAIFMITRFLFSLFRYQTWKTRSAFGPASAVLIVFLLWIPWHSEFLAQRARGLEQNWGRPQGIEHLTMSVSEMFGLMWNSEYFSLKQSQYIFFIFIIVIAFLTVFGKRSQRLLGLIVCCSFGLALFLASGSKSLIASWYFLFAHVFFLSALSVGIMRIPSTLWRRITLTVFLLGASIQFVQQLEWRAERIQLPSFQYAANYLEAMRGEGELIFVNGPRDFVAASPYLVSCEPMYVVSEKWDFVFGTGTAVVEQSKHLTQDKVAQLHAPRCWGIFATNRSINPKEIDMPLNWVDVAEERFNDWRYGQIVVKEYIKIDAYR